ncbi:MAG: stage V sporulation protein S [Chloroflexi bacterium]|nr:stage V sporulation protein S [Chloroflexota bacterium]
MQTLRVASSSNTTSVAGAIAWSVRDNGYAEIEAIGAGAVNQATKAVAVARGYLALEGVDIVLVPAFTTVTIADEERTAIKFLVEPRQGVVRPVPQQPAADKPLEMEAGSGV